MSDKNKWIFKLRDTLRMGEIFMFSLPYLCICIYCMLQISFLMWMDQRRKNTNLISEPYFSILLLLILCSFTADIVSSLYKSNGWVFYMAMIGNYAEILLNTTMLPIYFLYVCTQINDLDRKLKKIISRIIVVTAGCSNIILLSNILTHKIFYYDSEHQYYRGPQFWIPMCLMFLIMVIIQGFIIHQKHKIELNYFRSLFLFLMFPLVGWALQIYILGLPFSLISVAFAAVVVFVNIQNRHMDTDYLTGVYNRQSLDGYLVSKIQGVTEKKSFSALLLDIDQFKLINDKYGHYEGDMALIQAAKILKDSTKPKDFIARYGGDEFCVVFEEDNLEELDELILRIRDNLRNFNEHTKKSYLLSFSIGYEKYNPQLHQGMELFIKKIDQNMYEEKRERVKV